VLLWRATKKKSVEFHSKEQRWALSELSFKLALALRLLWFCNILFPGSTYFELIVLIAECVTLESHEKKNVLNVAARNRKVHFQRYLSNWHWHYDYYDSAKYVYFELKVFIAECGTLESQEEKKYVEWCSKEQRRAFSELSFELTLRLWLQWFAKYHFRLKFFRIESFDIGVCYFGELRKKNLLNFAVRNRDEHFQSYIFESTLTLWLQWFCKYHFQIQLISNWTFW